MNILFLTVTRLGSGTSGRIYLDLLKEFHKHGHNVHIISPNEKRLRLPNSDKIEDGLFFHRIKTDNLTKVSFFKKGLTTIKLQRGFLRGIKKTFKYIKFDILIYPTPPVTIAKTVSFLKKRDNSATYLLLKDIFPQNALDLNILKTSGLRGIIYRYFKQKEKQLYQVSDYIGCMSIKNVEYLTKNNNWLKNKTIEVTPNTITPKSIKPISISTKVSIRNKYSLPNDRVLFIYGGNLGKPQSIPFIIDCIKSHEKNPQGHMVIVGSGSEFKFLKKYFEQTNPTNASLLKSLDKKSYDSLVSASDVGLIFLDYRFTIPNFPSRILSYMENSIPVLAATDNKTDIGDTIKLGNFGDWCESNNSNLFVNKMEQFLNESNRLRMGFNSRQYLEKNYTSDQSYQSIIKHFK